MGRSLMDQLVGVGLVSEQKAKQADQDKRAKQKAQGKRPRGPEQPVGAVGGSLADAIAGGRETFRRGSRRWYWTAPDGRIHWVDLDRSLAESLEQGRLALVQDPQGQAVLVRAEAVPAVRAADPSALLAWRGR